MPNSFVGLLLSLVIFCCACVPIAGNAGNIRHVLPHSVFYPECGPGQGACNKAEFVVTGSHPGHGTNSTFWGMASGDIPFRLLDGNTPQDDVTDLSNVQLTLVSYPGHKSPQNTYYTLSFNAFNRVYDTVINGSDSPGIFLDLYNGANYVDEIYVGAIGRGQGPYPGRVCGNQPMQFRNYLPMEKQQFNRIILVIYMPGEQNGCFQ